MLRPDHQYTRADLSGKILNKWHQNPEGFLGRIIFAGENWFYLYNHENKSQPKWLPKREESADKIKESRCFIVDF